MRALWHRHWSRKMPQHTLGHAFRAAARLRDPFAKLHNPDMENWDDLRHFLAFARGGSTIAAAKSLGVNQSTVHRRLEALEMHLGRQLVERRVNGYGLTELGMELLP